MQDRSEREEGNAPQVPRKLEERFIAWANVAHPGVFALLIGINEYKDASIHNLKGAIADCESMRQFLEDEVGAHIQCLYDGDATREGIINAILYLASDERIQEGNPILIYYAGHGAEALPPAAWGLPETSKIQMILPYDFVLHPNAEHHHAEGDRSPKGGEGQGLFDRTLSTLLAELSDKKGDNIVVIFDCCHSGSGTRRDKLDTSIARGVDLSIDYAISASLEEADFPTDNDLGARAYIRVPSTHVLLAACQEDQKAKENGGHGLFTSALLETLRRNSPDKISYKDAILRLRDLGREQNPQCEGTNENRLFFNQCSKTHKIFYPLETTAGLRDGYLLRAGEAHGIRPGAEFSVYSTADGDSPPLGTLVAYKTSSFTSNLRFKSADGAFNVPPVAFALETRKGIQEFVRIAVEDDLRVKLQTFHQPDIAGIMLVGMNDDADLRLIQGENDTVGFEIVQKEGVHHALTHTEFRPGGLHGVIQLLQYGAHFYFHLHRSNNAGTLARKVNVSLLPLSFGLGDNGLLAYVPVQRGEDQNRNVGGLVNVCLDDGAIYGLKVTNTDQSRPIYLSVFYFNLGDLSIDSQYKPATAVNGKTPPCLSKGAPLTIGYGRSGELPLEFHMESDEQQLDVGFLKLFLSTMYIDHSDVEQDSLQSDKPARGLKPVPYGAFMTPGDVWDTVTITIIQRRKK